MGGDVLRGTIGSSEQTILARSGFSDKHEKDALFGKQLAEEISFHVVSWWEGKGGRGGVVALRGFLRVASDPGEIQRYSQGPVSFGLPLPVLASWLTNAVAALGVSFFGGPQIGTCFPFG